MKSFSVINQLKLSNNSRHKLCYLDWLLIQCQGSLYTYNLWCESHTVCVDKLHHGSENFWGDVSQYKWHIGILCPLPPLCLVIEHSLEYGTSSRENAPVSVDRFSVWPYQKFDVTEKIIIKEHICETQLVSIKFWTCMGMTTVQKFEIFYHRSKQRSCMC